MRSAPAALPLIAAAFALAACASSETVFVKDPPKFRATDADPGAHVWFDPDVEFTEYDRLLIDPTEVALVSGAGAKSVDPAVLRALAVEFHDTLVRVVDPYYSVIAEPAPRTLRVRTALTDVTLAPGGGTGDAVTSSRIEWELLDAQTGRRLGAGYRRRDAEPGANGFQVWADKLLDFMNRRAEIPR
jgi:uncharacterized protein DUF3313